MCGSPKRISDYPISMKKNKLSVILLSTICLLHAAVETMAFKGPRSGAGEIYSTGKSRLTADPLFSNIISINTDPICYNTAPQGLIGSYLGVGTFTYQWQASTASDSNGFTDLASGNSAQYFSGPLTQSTWFRRIVGSGGVYDTSNAVKATVLPETIALIINNPAAVCAPATIDLTAPAIVAGSPSGLTYGYYSNPEATNTVSNPSAISSFTNLDTYYYIKASNACTSAVAPVRVIINQKPDLSVVGATSTVCKGQEVELYAHSPGNSTEWIGIGTGPTVNVYPMISTTYTAQATSPQGCTRTATASIVVSDFKMSLSVASPTVTAGLPFTLQAGANQNFETVSWSPVAYFPVQTQGTQNITIHDSTRTFSVTGVSEDGCRDTTFLTVSPLANTTDIFIPNAFSPNRDGKNDVFKVYGSSIQEVEIRIYTQWGKLICDTKNNTNGWDGSYLGKPQPIGIYMYAIKIRLDNEDSFIRKGSINLIR